MQNTVQFWTELRDASRDAIVRCVQNQRACPDPIWEALLAYDVRNFERAEKMIEMFLEFESQWGEGKNI
jgi:hypothetical protein